MEQGERIDYDFRLSERGKKSNFMACLADHNVSSATALARKTGAKKGDVLRRWRADVGVVLAARRARMARRCMPTVSARAEYVVHGGRA